MSRPLPSSPSAPAIPHHGIRRRSSLPSAFLTGFVGWVGWMFVGPLLFGFEVPAGRTMALAIGSAIVHVALLRALFFPLQMYRGILIGAAWGSLVALALYVLTRQIMPDMQDHTLAWILTYVYIGAPVGGFLSYFYRDDEKLARAAALGTAAAGRHLGRDAHWMEPFGFGAVAYLLAFLPLQHLTLALNVAIVGAISGVAAAGASHFSPDRWKRSFVLLSLIIAGVGAVQGAATGVLFRHYAQYLRLQPWMHGALAGILTYAATFARGRYLAAKELASRP